MTTATKIDLTGIETVAETFEKAGLAWTAEPMQLIRADGRDVTTHKAIIRNDTGNQIGLVGKDYSIVQNQQAFSIMDILSQQHGAKFNSAIIYDGGRRVHLTANVGGITFKRGDEGVRKISIENSFDGSSGFTTFFWAERLVCKNGMRRVVKEAQMKMRHSGDVEAKMEDALKIMAISQEYFERFEIVCQKLTQKIADKLMVESFLKAVVGEQESKRQQNIAKEIENLFQYGKGNSGETAFDLYNGVTEYVDHFRGKDDSSRLANSMIGSGAAMKTNAFEFLANY